MGIDAVLRRRGSTRNEHIVAVALGSDETDKFLEQMQGNLPLLRRVDPVRALVLTASDMPELMGELEQAQSLAGTERQRQYVAATHALAEVCACDRTLELVFGGD